MAESPLNKLSLPAQAGIAAVLAVAICAAFYFMWWKPKSDEEVQKLAALKKLQGEIQALEVTANKLPEFQREVQLLEASLEKLKLILPTEKQMPDLMKRLQALMQQSSLAFKVFDPGNPAKKDFYQEVPITIRLTGSYHNLGMFFDRVGRLIRLVSVGNVQIQTYARQTATNTVSASLVARAYVYVEPPPNQPQPAKSGTAGKKKK